MDEAAIPTAALRSALLFAVDVALLHSKKRPPLPYPLALRPLLKLHHRKHTARTLQTVRTALDNDPNFRAAVAAQARPDLVNAVGMTYLHGGDGWAKQAVAAAVDQESSELVGAASELVGELAAELANEQRRREAAEAALERLTRSAAQDRARAEALADESLRRAGELLAAVTIERDDLRAEVFALGRQLEQRTQQLRMTSAQFNERDGAVADLTEHSHHLARQLEQLRAALAEAETARDAVLAERSADHARAAGQGEHGARLGGNTAWYRDVRPLHRPRQRQPIALPGGVLGESRAGAEFLLRAQDALVVVDGYNVAMLGWPDRDLQYQRERLIERLEDIARRWGTDVIVIFDGAPTTGASSRARRLIHVEYAVDEKADPAIVRRVAQTDLERPVVVVTNDRQILADVRRLGANGLASGDLLAAMNR